MTSVDVKAMSEPNVFISSIISRMTLDEKIGGCMTLGFNGVLVTPRIFDFIEKYHCSGLRVSPHVREFGSYIDPRDGKVIVKIEPPLGYKKGDLNAPYVLASRFKEILDAFQRRALNRRLGIPLHFSFDFEGGGDDHYNMGNITHYPSQMGIRAMNDPRWAFEIARAVARENRAMGFNFIHSPVLDVNINPRSPDGYTRAFSDRVEEVTLYGEAAARGYREGRVIAAAKHFPGQGLSVQDSHYSLPVVALSRDQLRALVAPYKNLFDKKLLPAVMVAHSMCPSLDKDNVSTVSKKIVTDFLRGELGFDGVITTDSITMAGVAVRYGVAPACALALQAGADLVLLKAEGELVDQAYAEIRKFVESGRITEKSLDEKLYRILMMKYEYGLFGPEGIASAPYESARQRIGGPALAELTARRALIVARDRKGMIPLSPDKRYLIVEQIAPCPEDIDHHTGMFFKFCLEHSRNLRFVETAWRADEDDQRRVLAELPRADGIIMTNYYDRSRLSGNALVETLAKSGKPLAIVTNTPYPALSIPDSADCALVTFCRSPQSMHAAAAVLFGRASAEGVWPIAFQIPK